MTNICKSFFGVLGSCFCCCCKPKEPETNSESNESNFNTSKLQKMHWFEPCYPSKNEISQQNLQTPNPTTSIYQSKKSTQNLRTDQFKSLTDANAQKDHQRVTYVRRSDAYNSYSNPSSTSKLESKPQPQNSQMETGSKKLETGSQTNENTSYSTEIVPKNSQSVSRIREFTFSKTDKELNNEFNEISKISLEDAAKIHSCPWNNVLNRYSNIYSSDSSSMSNLKSKFEEKINRESLKSFAENNWNYEVYIDNAKNLLATEAETLIIPTNYINGSYIGDEEYEKNQCPHKFSYIATQGPTKSSFHQFWFMCWEKECKVIVMLCNFEEKGKEKCFEYLPVSEGKVLSTDLNSDEHFIRIECSKRSEFKNTSENTFLVHRELLVTKCKLFEGKYYGKSKIIQHIQFTGWPDCNVPNVEDLNFLMGYFRGIYPEENHNDPVVVHCSAGVGRTGTFITIDTSLRKIRTDHEYDPFNCVKRLRAKRTLMVQTANQYELIHTYLENYFRSKSDLQELQNRVPERTRSPA